MPTKTENLQERVAIVEKTAVTWQQLFTSVGVIVLIVGGLASLFYKTLLTSQIEQGISKSAYLSKNFAEVEKQFSLINARLDKFVSTSPILNPKILTAVLKEAISGDSISLASNLPNVRNMLTIAREKKVPLPDQTYKEISKPLFIKYDSAKQPLRQELWLTFIELANTRTSTDNILHPVSESEIQRAKDANNFFEGNVDLSSRTTWKDTIFRNCTFTITNPGNDLTLTRVRFIDSEFQFVSESSAGRNLFQSLLESDISRVTAIIARFAVDQPIGKTNPPS
jgi:hypothetical protein